MADTQDKATKKKVSRVRFTSAYRKGGRGRVVFSTGAIGNEAEVKEALGPDEYRDFRKRGGIVDHG